MSPALPTSTGALFGEASERERRILLAALERFVAVGFHAARIPEIAQAAGVAAGTIYNYFPSKEELVNALLAGLRRHLARELAEVLPRPDGDVRAEFDALWGVFARFGLHHRQAVAFCELHHHAAYASPAVLAAWAPGERLLDAHFERGRRERIYRDQPPAVLRAVVAGVLMGVHKFSRAGLFALDEAVLEEARGAAWRAVTRG